MPHRGFSWRYKMSDMKILVVDDESRMRKLLKDFLTGKGYLVLEAEDGQQALDIFFANDDIKLVLLDVMMPKLDGWGVLKEIRQYSETPVIMLTAKADEQDELNGFNLGVDEYIAKPFSLKILSARIDAVLRRTSISDEADLEVDGIKINKLAHQVTVDGKVVELSVKEFELLSYFMLNRGIALSRNKILNSVWQYEYDGGARTIDTHVKKLRSKLGEKGKYITTIWGYGYKFESN
jgi:DNA-binding response OmpR family regulator